jgi:hypothetical protein
LYDIGGENGVSHGNLSQNSLFKADTSVRSVAEAEFWDWFFNISDKSFIKGYKEWHKELRQG